ncbi:MAG: replication-relaxation family protein [Chloroflexi bacterium]|nr:replication-relaxation family protein [Chloroflexota bacterium]MCC6891446.1 replication-relaxation family protein [Anaerolineae bacterium]
MRLTDRDRRILEAVHAYDGMLSENQIRALFFTGRTATQVRLMLLYQHGYLNRPDRRQRAALPAMIYWLSEKGAALVAGLYGQHLSEFTWHKQPRMMQVEHDLAVNDLRILIQKACHSLPQFALKQWIAASEFHAAPDRVEFVLPNKSKATRFIRPDGYCVISKSDYTSRLLIEVDRGTEDNGRITIEKLLPGLAYIRSETYKARFGFSSGRWIFVTTSDRRLKNMKQAAEVALKQDAKLFYFTTFERITDETIFTEAIWLRGGDEVATTLFPVQ